MNLFSKPNKYFFLALLGSFLLLTSCGFHLRGTVPLATPLQHLYLQVADPYSSLTRNLRQSLASSGVQLVSSPAEADAVLIILKENPSQQLLSVGSTQQTRQYNLILSVTFQINDARGKILIPPQTVSESRSLTLQSNQILGTSNEQDDLYQQMRQAVVYDIMNRLSSKEITTLLNSEKAL